MDRGEDIYKDADRRCESRSREDRYISVEFSTRELEHVYQFRIWDLSKSGMGILVKEGSEVLKHVEVGDVLNMRYYAEEPTQQPVCLKTEIKHITKDDQGPFRGNYLVGLSILEKQNGNP